jgi:hypothetical protein
VAVVAEGAQLTRVDGPTTGQIDRAGLDYTALLERHLDQTVRQTARLLGDTVSADDLGLIPKLWMERVDDRLLPTLGVAFLAGAAGVADQLRGAVLTATGVKLADVPPVPPQLIQAYLQTARNRLTRVGDLTWELARQQLLEGAAKGESQRRLATRIHKATGLALPRARLIARNEARDALLAGSLNQVRATGLTGTKRWVAVTRSARTRPDHRHAHGQEVDLQAFFKVGGWPLDRPHDPTGPADEVMGCRCGLSYQLDTADLLLGPNPPRAQPDRRLLDQVWGAGILRRGITQAALEALLVDLGLTAGGNPAGGSVTLPVAGSQEDHVPWTVSNKRSECPGGYAVVNQDTGEMVRGGCHKSKADAVKHQRALYQNVEEAGMTTTAAEHETAEELAKRAGKKGMPPELRDCPPGMIKDPDTGDCVRPDETESTAAEGAETLVSESPWNGAASRFTDEQYRAAAAVCEGDGPPKTACHLPHHEPGGAVSRAGVHAAAAGRGVSRLSSVGAEALARAKAHLRGHYTRDLNEEPPDSLKASTSLDAWVTLDTEDAETAGGKPNPGTDKDKRLHENDPKRKKRRTSAATESKIEATGDGRWEGILVIEGIPTGDGREFAPDALVFADFPLPLTYQPPTHGGEPGPAVDVGVIEDAWRDEQNPRVIRGRGRFDMADQVAADYYRKVQEGFLRGMSVDLDDIDPLTDVELVWPDGMAPDQEGGGLEALFTPPSKRIFHKARVRGAALLSMPAFVEAQMWAEGTDPPELPDLDEVEQAARAEQEQREQEHSKEPAAVTAAAVARLDDFRPPAEWFRDPGLGVHTPIVVTDDMRVYGHAFQWDQCHIGYGDQCVTPPQEDDFPFYTQGTVLTADGSSVPVGAITLGMGHAPIRPGVTARAAAEHYDNTDAVVADVAIGCDRVGAWVAGWIRPGTDPRKVYALRASGQVSGDWRMIGGRLRLVALLTVNVPGFPVPRPEARVAGGQVVAMVAAGMLDVGPRIDWEAELEQRALRNLRDKALAGILKQEEGTE